MNKKIIIGIIVFVVIIGVAIALAFTAGTSKGNEKDDNVGKEINDADKIENKEDESNIDKEEAKTNELTKASLSLYNEITDSKHLSVVLYDSQKERQGTGDKNDFDKSIIVTYDVGATLNDNILKNDFMVTAEKKQGTSLKYFFGIDLNDYMAYSCISTNKLEDGSFDIAKKDALKEGVQFYKDKMVNSISTSNKEYKNNYDIYGNNFKATNYEKLENVKSSNKISLKIGETTEDNIYMSVTLKEQVSYGDSFVQEVEKNIEKGNIESTITVLNDVDNLSSVDKVFGKQIDLNDTIFYQDVIATKISDNYGLNLRNKDFFVKVDTRYITYKAYGEDNYLTEVTFNNVQEKEDYVDISTAIPDNSFSYTDADNNQYSYFVDEGVGTFYIFKNEAFVGTLKVTHKGKVSTNLYGDLNYIFGIK